MKPPSDPSKKPAAARSNPAALLGAGVVALAVLGAVVWVGQQQRSGPDHCGPGWVDGGSRCCAPGQKEAAGRCTGSASSCTAPLMLVSGNCEAPVERVRVAGGVLLLGPNDWEAEGVVTPRRLELEGFELDRFEVSVGRWNRCVEAEICARRRDNEPGLPMTGVTPKQAEQLCRLAGGRLPTSDEWIFAAASSKAHRYPWGQTGLVCRRAVFGRLAGPCGHSASAGPEFAGAVPDGKTPSGIFDLAGNVAEWTREAEGKHVARGGSFRSQVAAELKSWAVTRPGPSPSDDVGFRCAY